MRLSQWLLLIILSVLWGASFLFVGIAVKDLPVLTIVTARVGLAALILVPIVVAMGNRAIGYRLPTTLAGWAPFAVMGLLNNVVPMSLIVAGQTQISVGLAAVLNATTPLFALLVAYAFAGEKLAANKIGGIALGIAGVAMLMGPAVLSERTSGLVGMLCGLGGALSYGLSGLWGRQFKSTPPLVTAAGQLTCSTVLLLPITLAIDRPWQLAMPSDATIAAVIALAVLATALAYIIFFRIMAVSGSNNVMLVTLLVPVSGIALGHVVLAEPLVAHHLVGAAVIAASLLLIDGRIFSVVRRRRRG